jgi:hypothetical protein
VKGAQDKRAVPLSCQSSCHPENHALPDISSDSPSVLNEARPGMEDQYYAGTSFPVNGWIHPCRCAEGKRTIFAFIIISILVTHSVSEISFSFLMDPPPPSDCRICRTWTGRNVELSESESASCCSRSVLTGGVVPLREGGYRSADLMA